MVNRVWGSYHGGTFCPWVTPSVGSRQTSEDVLIWQEKKKNQKQNQRQESRATVVSDAILSGGYGVAVWLCVTGGQIFDRTLEVPFIFTIRIQHPRSKVWQVSPICVWERRQSQRAWRELHLNGAIVCVGPIPEIPSASYACMHAQ